MFKFRKMAVMCLSVLATASLAVGLASCEEETVTPCTHPHEHENILSSDAEYHWYSCKVEGCTEKIGQSAHIYDEGVVITPPSDEEGEREYTCVVCGATKTESIDKIEYLGDHNEQVLMKAGVGSTYQYIAQNPGRYIVTSLGENVAGVKVWSNDVYSVPAYSNGEGIVYIDVAGGATIYVLLSQNGSSDAYANVTVQHDKYATMQSIAYLEHFPSQTLTVPVGGRAFGRFINIVEPVTLSWESENLALTINGETRTKADCPITLERDTFNPSGIYFVASMLDSGLSENVDPAKMAVDFTLTLTRGEKEDLEVGMHTVSVAKNLGSTYTYVAQNSGTYTFITTDASVSQFNVSASDAIQTGDGLTQAGSVSIAVTKGEEIALNIAHTANQAQDITFYVTYTPFAESDVKTLAVPSSSTSASTVIDVDAYSIVTTTLPQGSYYFTTETTHSNATYFASSRIWIDGREYSGENTFSLFKDAEVIIYSMLFNESFEKIENEKIQVSITLSQTTNPETISTGKTSVTLPSLAEEGAKNLYFVAETTGIYTISLTADESCMLTANDGSWMLSSFRGCLSVSLSLQAGEAVSFTVTSLLQETGDVTFVIAQN